MGNQYTRQDDMFTIFTGQQKLGCIVQRGRKYRLAIGRVKRKMYSLNTRLEAERLQDEKNKIYMDENKEKTIYNIMSSNLSNTLKKKYVACTNRVYKNNLREKLPREIVIHLSEKYGDARKNSCQEGRKTRQFNITFDYVLEMYAKTKGLCPFFQEPFVINNNSLPKYMRNYEAPSIDRWDNSKGYVYGNIKIMSWDANRMKGNLSLDKFEKFLNNGIKLLRKRGKKSE